MMGQEDPCQLCPANLNPASAEWLKKVAQLKQAKTSLSTWLTSPWFTCLISAKAVDARKIKKKHLAEKSFSSTVRVCQAKKKLYSAMSFLMQVSTEGKASVVQYNLNTIHAISCFANFLFSKNYGTYIM